MNSTSKSGSRFQIAKGASLLIQTTGNKAPGPKPTVINVQTNPAPRKPATRRRPRAARLRGSGRSTRSTPSSARGSVAKYAAQEHNSHLMFAAGLAAPSRMLCRKWPQPIPAPTFSCKWSGSFTATSNAGGNFIAWLVPPSSAIPALNITTSNNALLTSTSSSNTWAPASFDSPSFLTNFDSMRMVSAELVIRDTTNLLTRQGVFYSGSVVYQQLVTNAFTIGALRDQYFEHHAGTDKAVKAIAIPMDTSAGEWVSNTRSWSTPVVAVMGGAPNGSYTIEYHVNLEAIPNSANTDMLSTVPGAVGDASQGLVAAGKALLNNGYQYVAANPDVAVETALFTLAAARKDTAGMATSAFNIFTRPKRETLAI